MPLRHRLALGLAIIAFPLVAACASSAASAPKSAAAPASGGPLTLTALDTMKFDPGTLSVKAGQQVQLTVDNKGQVLHDIQIESGPAQPVKIEVKPGEKASATFQIAKPGTYTFFCSQPGHEAAGMKGSLTVQ